MLAKFARLTASGDLWLLQVPGAGRADTVTLCSLVLLLRLNLCLYQTETFLHCLFLQGLCAASFRARWAMGLKGICWEQQHPLQLSLSTAQNTFHKQVLFCYVCDPGCEISEEAGFWDVDGFDSHHLLSCFVSLLMLAIPSALLMPNPSLWTSICVNGKLPFF